MWERERPGGRQEGKGDGAEERGWEVSWQRQQQG